MPSFNDPTVLLVIQITIGLIIVLVLYVITLVVLRIDSIVSVSSNKVKQNSSTLIVDGYAPISWLADRKYNTTNQYARNFKQIARSLNRRGGAQFSYQFWIKIDEGNSEYYKDLIVLMRGQDKKYKIGLYDQTTNALVKELEPGYAIACPMIKFTDSYKNMRVHLNTNNDPYTFVDIKMSPELSIGKRDVLSFAPVNWLLYTFIFEDSYSHYTSHENGIRMQFWVNDFMYQQETNSLNYAPFRENFIKQNDGDLYLFPELRTRPPAEFLKLANVKYYNYAVSENEIRETFKAGRPSHTAARSDEGNQLYELGIEARNN
jgi:hypothetical protein